MEGMLREWQACWVTANPKPEDDDWAAIYAYIIGQDRWVATDTWPPQDSQRTRVYLSPGRLSLEKPDSEEASSSFVYDPSHPVPTIAGNNLIAPRGIRDHRSHAARDDVLVFESEPLDREITLLGPLRARLFVSSDAPDTDFTAMLLDVRPDGYRANVQDGIVRLRYRHGRQRPEFVAPGQVVPVDVDLWSTGYAFPPGHRIALHVSSSNFPRFDRHLNTSDPPWSWTEPRKARNTVYHDAERASYVELPVLP
jgi:putative CocE/NonD family hydrolase